MKEGLGAIPGLQILLAIPHWREQTRTKAMRKEITKKGIEE